MMMRPRELGCVCSSPQEDSRRAKRVRRSVLSPMLYAGVMV